MDSSGAGGAGGQQRACGLQHRRLCQQASLCRAERQELREQAVQLVAVRGPLITPLRPFENAGPGFSTELAHGCVGPLARDSHRGPEIDHGLEGRHARQI